MKRIQPTADLFADHSDRAPRLDMGSVRTSYDEPPSALGNAQQSNLVPEGTVINAARKSKRHFGLPDAPTFYPTLEEFAHPLKYIEKIRPQAEHAGICKIVPPSKWKPTFALDTETFRFRTRKQQLNSLEGKTRANLNYLEQLYKFHAQQGHPVTKIPHLAKRPIDLYGLKNEVAARGGFQRVTAEKKWAEIGRELNYARDTCTSLSNSLKKAYSNIVLPYETYLARVKRQESSASTPASPSIGSVAPTTPLRSQPTGTDNLPLPSASTPGLAVPSVGIKQETTANGADFGGSSTVASSQASDVDPSEESRLSRRRSKRLKVEKSQDTSFGDADLRSAGGSGTPRSRMAPPSTSTPKSGPAKKASDASDSSSEVCRICRRGDHGDQMLLCDGCDNGFHLFCLDPPLKKVPNNDWYCTQCILQAGDDFGFEDGDEYSLHSFQQKCNNFKRRWFASYFEGTDGADLVEDRVPEQVTEAEFWRLVQSPYEDVEVEYGADLHSMQHGSGFPTKERNPLDPYSLDPWNLNIIPILPDSLFSFIKSDISGMMNPWLYVGMCFSTFCWHNEDHYTYSINYMHWGDTKTWYGIPGAHAERFEDTMRQAVPELFEQQPDLLFQLVTMLSPGTLVENGVDVYALDQRPGQFVVTFPKAYHAGFNHGFNFAEAVNFATPDWISFGEDSVVRYQAYHRLPVFSHDELLVAIATTRPSIEVAEWLLPFLKRMVDRELAERNRVRHAGQSVGREICEEKDYGEDEYKCTVCKAFSYLSAVVCSCTTQIACLRHATELCACPASARTLRLRYTDESLRNIIESVTSIVTVPREWVRRFRSLMIADSVQVAHKGPKDMSSTLVIPPTSGGGYGDVPFSQIPHICLKPSFPLICQLLAEADRIPSVIYDARVLRMFVDRVMQWIREVHTFLFITPPPPTDSTPDGSSNANPSAPSDRSRSTHPGPSYNATSFSVHHDRALSDVNYKNYLSYYLPSGVSLEAAHLDSPEILDHLASKIPPLDQLPITESHTVERVEELMLQADQLSFSSPEVPYLESMRRRGIAFRHRIQSCLVNVRQTFLFQPIPTATFLMEAAGDPQRMEALHGEIVHVHHVLAEGETLPLYIPERHELQSMLSQLEWSLKAQSLLTRAASALRLDGQVVAQQWYSVPEKMSFDALIGLLEEAVEQQIPGENSVFISLMQAKHRGDQWSESTADFFNKTEVTLEEILELLGEGFRLLPYEPLVFTRLQQLGQQFSSMQQEARQMLMRTREQDITKRPLVSEMRGLLERFDALYQQPPAFRPNEVFELKDEQAVIDSWILRGKKLFARGNMPKKWVEMLLEVEEATKRCTTGPPSLSIAYRSGSGSMAGPTLDPVVRQKFRMGDTSSDDEVPGMHHHGPYRSKAKSKRWQGGVTLYCVCRQPEQGFMVECDICREWYHGGCLKLSRRQTKAQSYFICPICDPLHVDMPHPTKRPSLDILIAHAQEGEKLPFVTLELDPLVTIILDMSKFRERIQQALHFQQRMQGPVNSSEDVSTDAVLPTTVHSGHSSGSASPTNPVSSTRPTAAGLLALYQALLRRTEGMEVSLPFEEAELRKWMMRLRLRVRSSDPIADEWLRFQLPNEKPRIKQQLVHERRQQRSLRVDSSPVAMPGVRDRGHGLGRKKEAGERRKSSPGLARRTIRVGPHYLRTVQMAFHPTARYCLCQLPFDPKKAMVSCNTCRRWYHLECVHVPLTEASTMDSYQCPLCAVRLKIPYRYGEIVVENGHSEPDVPQHPSPYPSHQHPRSAGPTIEDDTALFTATTTTSMEETAAPYSAPIGGHTNSDSPRFPPLDDTSTAFAVPEPLPQLPSDVLGDMDDSFRLSPHLHGEDVFPEHRPEPMALDYNSDNQNHTGLLPPMGRTSPLLSELSDENIEEFDFEPLATTTPSTSVVHTTEPLPDPSNTSVQPSLMPQPSLPRSDDNVPSSGLEQSP
ncbi:hypothetical protein IWQ62_000535 [Dispira parvispora]|uniref:[histone H3]-trimethyl-L-lysine(4) demethylase n=1 Tax=Dispira parvispora TaxID=1520584 RepID=A0A9W8E946_9FUNG|nr:hypothetical protein IWQ62_000535 [Dispira parvispora]